MKKILLLWLSEYLKNGDPFTYNSARRQNAIKNYFKYNAIYYRLRAPKKRSHYILDLREEWQTGSTTYSQVQ